MRRLLPTAALLALLTGCSTISDLSHLKYQKGILRLDGVEREAVGALAMVSRIALAEEAKVAATIFFKNLKEQRTDLRLIPPEEAEKRIEKAGLLTLQREVEEAMRQDRVPQEEKLRSVGRAVGARFLLLSELVQSEVIEGATQVTLRGRLWDVELGEIVWEGIGEARGYIFFIFPKTPASLEKTAETASRGLLKMLP